MSIDVETLDGLKEPKVEIESLEVALSDVDVQVFLYDAFCRTYDVKFSDDIWKSIRADGLKEFTYKTENETIRLVIDGKKIQIYGGPRELASDFGEKTSNYLAAIQTKHPRESH